MFADPFGFLHYKEWVAGLSAPRNCGLEGILMKVGVIAASVAALVTMVFASAAMAQTGQTEVCASYDGKYELDGGWEGFPGCGNHDRRCR